MSEDWAKLIAEAIGTVLKPERFRRRGRVFVADNEDVALIVQLQSSTKSTRERFVATVNLGAFSWPLSRKLGRLPRAPTMPECHWRERIGYLMPEPTDRWWEVGGQDEAEQAAHEMADAVWKYGLPALRGVASTPALRELWASGRSPGLTKGMREAYLAKLRDES